MSNVSKFNKWKFVKEARKPRKCPIIDFTPIREAELYKDVISLGWVEVNAQGHPRIEQAMEDAGILVHKELSIRCEDPIISAKTDTAKLILMAQQFLMITLDVLMLYFFSVHLLTNHNKFHSYHK